MVAAEAGVAGGLKEVFDESLGDAARDRLHAELLHLLVLHQRVAEGEQPVGVHRPQPLDEDLARLAVGDDILKRAGALQQLEAHLSLKVRVGAEERDKDAPRQHEEAAACAAAAVGGGGFGVGQHEGDLTKIVAGLQRAGDDRASLLRCGARGHVARDEHSEDVNRLVLVADHLVWLVVGHLGLLRKLLQHSVGRAREERDAGGAVRPHGPPLGVQQEGLAERRLHIEEHVEVVP
mmetsp:Transcript_48628/g.134878  ORF Transcript_48628/g.134878 Transcript_48628/m.134878 type:complete len:235 (-) Transcript_48628:654-1358(-)